ncbi:hypothetical protein B2M20_10860 [Nitrobacter vulgaris]|uniref:Uncharacterized protein n=1 Tax=Nitrobacter vulgaris TaxID=29421 RepID=A0A1V4HXY4_NITVU|nr:hypothetical protein B2M20_10860 [Nitrobacter vulgaris]
MEVKAQERPNTARLGGRLRIQTFLVPYVADGRISAFAVVFADGAFVTNRSGANVKRIAA